MDDSQQPAISIDWSLRRVLRLALPAGLMVLVFVAWEVAPAWLGWLWSELARSTQRQVVSVVLHAMLAAYCVTLVFVVVGLPALGVFMVRSRERPARGKWLARLFLLGISTLICLVGLEAGAALQASLAASQPRAADHADRDGQGSTAPADGFSASRVGAG